jgi:hypothetical protein
MSKHIHVHLGAKTKDADNLTSLISKISALQKDIDDAQRPENPTSKNKALERAGDYLRQAKRVLMFT